MRLLFKQKLFSWFDSYDIYDENNQIVFTVKGELSWGHRLKVFDSAGNVLGVLQQKVFTWLPCFEIYINNELIGTVKREFTFFKNNYRMDFKGWYIDGDVFEWDYEIKSRDGKNVAYITKQLFKMTDTYSLNIANREDALYVLMLVLAIDADKCSRRD